MKFASRAAHGGGHGGRGHHVGRQRRGAVWAGRARGAGLRQAALAAGTAWCARHASGVRRLSHAVRHGVISGGMPVISSLSCASQARCMLAVAVRGPGTHQIHPTIRAAVVFNFARVGTGVLYWSYSAFCTLHEDALGCCRCTPGATMLSGSSASVTRRPGGRRRWWTVCGRCQWPSWRREQRTPRR